MRWPRDGLRTVAIASRPWSGPTREVETSDETELVFEGLCAFADPPKPTAAAAIARLAGAGVRLKILSGDDPVVVKRLAGLVGLNAEQILSGSDIAALSDDALAVQVQSVDAYGRLAPDQKSRIVKALQANGQVVGFLGDGINDAPALKVADIGLSVEGATGVAQAAADMILLASDLEVVADGVEEGRRTFANILKYVRMGASSNFGNMLSMAVASIALPFLPMLPTQILLNNLLYDLSELGIPFDNVQSAGDGAAAIVGHARADAVRRHHGTALLGVRFSDFRRAAVRVQRRRRRNSEPRGFSKSMATQILVIFIIRTNGRPWKNLPASGAYSVVAGRAGGRDDPAVHADRRMVRLRGAAADHARRDRPARPGLSCVRRTAEAVRGTPCRRWPGYGQTLTENPPDVTAGLRNCYLNSADS